MNKTGPVISIRLDPELFNLLAQVSIHTSTPMSAVHRGALRKGIQAQCDSLCVAADRPVLNLRVETSNQKEKCQKKHTPSL
jgi:predicted DNA-binding protein